MAPLALPVNERAEPEPHTAVGLVEPRAWEAAEDDALQVQRLVVQPTEARAHVEGPHPPRLLLPCGCGAFSTAGGHCSGRRLRRAVGVE
jgi:hypothetical protein